MRMPCWVITTSLLLTWSASAQQSVNPSVPPATAQTLESAAPSGPASLGGQAGPQLAASASTTPVSVAPATIDQAVDRAIERERALMEMLKSRTPLVETYLQNLKLDPQAGPLPVQDHYFLGRMDLGEHVGRRDYLAKENSFESHLLGGFARLYKFEYKPMGFSWMIYVDRDDFNRQTYDFKYLHREFVGDVRCIVFQVTPKPGTGKGRFRG